jgi:hypothetical protein
MVDQEGRKKREQVHDGEHEQPVSSAAIGPGAPVQPTSEQKKNRPADRRDRAIHRAGKPQYPG